MFYCTINHEENSFSLPLWSVGRIPSKINPTRKGAKEWLRNANQRKDSHLARTVDFWQYLTRTGRIYNLDIYNSFFKNTAKEISNIELMDGQWDQTNCVSFCHQWGLISISRRKTCYSVKISISISRRSYITSFQCTLTKLRYFVDYKCGIVKNMHFRKQTMSSECRQKEHFDILFELNWNSTKCFQSPFSFILNPLQKQKV